MSAALAAALAFLAGLLVGGAAVYALLRRAAPAGRPAGATAAGSRPVTPEPVPPAQQDEEVRAAMAASQATLEELEGRYRGRRAAGPEEPEKPARSRRRKR